MFRTAASKAAALLAPLALASGFLAAPVQAASVQLSVSTCDSFSLSGQAPNQVLTCVVSNAPTGCTIQGPTTGTINTPITLTAQCATGAPTSWAWTGGNCQGVATQSCSANSASATPVTYNVTPSNGIGAGNTASSTVTWTNTPPAAPTGCSLTATAVGSGGGATTLTATCSGGGAPTSYAWTASPAPSSGFSASTAANTQAPTIAATTNFTVTPSNGGGNGNTAAATATVAGGGGGGGISCPGFSNTVVMDENWAAPTQLRTSGISDSTAVIVRFTPTGATSGFNFPHITAGNGDQANRTGILSPNACDFSTPPVLGWYAWSNGNTTDVSFSVGPNVIGYPALTSGTTYYYNLKTTQGTCGGSCEMIIQLRSN